MLPNHLTQQSTHIYCLFFIFFHMHFGVYACSTSLYAPIKDNNTMYTFVVLMCMLLIYACFNFPQKDNYTIYRFLSFDMHEDHVLVQFRLASYER